MVENQQNRIHFLPGNHDPVSLFTPLITINECHNSHFSFYEIESNLFLGGIGGAVPGFQKGVNDEFAFEGFPFESQKDLDASYSEFISQFEKTMTDHQFIFMTHCGPFYSQTSLLYENEREFLTGGIAFDSILKQFNSNLLMHVHGHAHNGGTLVRCLIIRL